MVEEFEVPLRLAAARGFRRGTALATTAQFATVSFTSSFSFWWCSVLLGVLFVCVICVVVVVFASTRYVRIFLFLYDVAVLMPFIKKKELNASFVAPPKRLWLLRWTLS